jgi:NDP-sugar pyrophosphorylase family protein
VHHLFTTSNFFDLSLFQHAKLFENLTSVWDAIPRIAPFLTETPLGSIEIEIPAGAHLIHPELITIGKGSVVEPGAYIKGPCLIGKNCIIRQGAYIRGDVITGDDCVIGHDTEIKNTLLLNHAHAAHFAYLGDSILGNHVNLGAGTICANLRLNRAIINVYLDGRSYSSGLRKFGAILGDGVQLGCHTVTNPGTLMGKNSSSHPCVNFGGVIPAGSIIKSRAGIEIITPG